MYLLQGYLSSQLHELGHWAAAAALGLPLTLGFNRWQVEPASSTAQRLIVLTAGPAVSFALVGCGLLALFRGRRASLRRLGAFLMSFNALFTLLPYAFQPLTGAIGDEGWVASYLGIPALTLRLPIAAILLLALGAAWRWLDSGLRRPASVAVLLAGPMAVAGLLVGLDNLAWGRARAGDLLFQPIGGIYPAVLVVNACAALVYAALVVSSTLPAESHA